MDTEGWAMGFDFRRYVGCLVIVLLCGNFAKGQERQDGAEITVLVNNNAGVSLAVLHQAESEASRIFRVAGIEITWVDCVKGADGVDDACRRAPGPNDFVLHIVPQGKASSNWVFGLAFLDEDGAGKYSDIFFERIQQLHRQFGTPLSRLLGTVAAHELGHLLLGSHSHSYAGIMAPVWEKKALRHMEMGGLLFSGDQARRMRARVGGDESIFVSMGAGAQK
jgi:hypothetical protein